MTRRRAYTRNSTVPSAAAASPTGTGLSFMGLPGTLSTRRATRIRSDFPREPPAEADAGRPAACDVERRASLVDAETTESSSRDLAHELYVPRGARTR